MISEEIAIKYFGQQDPVGKTLLVDDKFSVTVSGVTEKFPGQFTHSVLFYLPGFSPSSEYDSNLPVRYQYAMGWRMACHLPTTTQSGKMAGNRETYSGGSTEITYIHDGLPRKSRSFPIGTVRLMDGKVKQEFLDEMEEWVKKQSARLKEIKGLGTGGNISKLYRMSGAQQKGEFMPIAQLEEMYRKICTMSVKVVFMNFD